MEMNESVRASDGMLSSGQAGLFNNSMVQAMDMDAEKWSGRKNMHLINCESQAGAKSGWIRRKKLWREARDRVLQIGCVGQGSEN